MLLHDKKVAIVGGGMSGLTLARLLQMKGVKVHVYERDENRDIRVQGSTLDLHEGTGLEAMKRAGLLAEFYKLHRPEASKMILADKYLNIKFNENTFSHKMAEKRPEIDRAPLRDILLNSLETNTVIWNSHFVSMEKQQNGWLLRFKNGESAYADFVIAADGAKSKIRSYLSTIKPVYSGVTLIHGDIDATDKVSSELFSYGKIMAFDDEKMLGFGTKGDGSVMFIASFKCPENWINECSIDFQKKAAVLSWFKEEFHNWSAYWDVLFTSPNVHFTPRPQYYFPFDQYWEPQENLTMIGDATHWMPPFAGEGANVAMQDAFELADALTNKNYPDIKTAIADFEKDMVSRGAAATQETLKNMEIMFSKNGLEQMVAFFTEKSKEN